MPTLSDFREVVDWTSIAVATTKTRAPRGDCTSHTLSGARLMQGTVAVHDKIEVNGTS